MYPTGPVITAIKNVYRSEENPQNIENGGCTNSTLAGGDPCFALEVELDLKAGVETELNVFLGTAMTEESEFREIYNLDVIEIPTNKPLARIDRTDVIYKNEGAKFRAVINDIKESNNIQPYPRSYIIYEYL